LTQFANLVLISSVTWRLTRSRAAGFLARSLDRQRHAGHGDDVDRSLQPGAVRFLSAGQLLVLLLYVETEKRHYLVLEW